ncbi:MAG: hypothetical protein QOH88_2726 [Verrucomicrobiota bacterium]|jgi:hypothetical protein
MASASLRALLEHSIDYAGLFPPASLALKPALRNHAAYVRDPDAWMLGAFILPTGQFAAAAESLSQFDQENPLRISALGKKTENTAAFLESLAEMRDPIRSFRDRNGGIVSINQVELPLPVDLDEETLRQARSAVDELKLNAFLETPADAAERTIGLLAKNNSDAGAIGFKLRTGGVTAEAFPSSGQIAKALVAAAKNRVPIKFTAGLHHPVRRFHASVETKMHGFLNVLGGSVLAVEHQWDAEQTARMLDDEDPAAFSFDDNFFAWREWKVGTERIRKHRKLVTSLGSCSFDEPREDLRALKLL